MAGDDDDVIKNIHELELEAKRTTDNSWHPCQVSLSSGGQLSVKFENEGSEEIICNVDDAFSCLRVRSAPLRGDDCGYIEEGKHVVAAHVKNFQTLFFDAMVEKAVRVRHSKRACCRCTFLIKWLSQDVGNETLTVPSGSIMKLAAESINSHPVVAAFLDAVNNTSLSTPSASPAAFDDTEGEIDLHGLLGRQIEEIGSLVDVSNGELLKDTLLAADHGVDSAGRDRQIKLLASEPVGVSTRINQLRRSGRKQIKSEVKAEDLVTTALSSVDTLENRSPLSPLAARAALASVVSKLPQKIEFINSKERVSMFDYGTCNHSSLEVMNGTITSGGFDSLTFNDIENQPAKIKANEGDSGRSRRCNESETLMSSGSSPSFSMRDDQLTHPVQARRLTRSAAKPETGTSNGEVKSRKLDGDMMIARVTRSGAQRRNEKMTDEVKVVLQDKPVRVTRTASAAVERDSETLYREERYKIHDEKVEVTTIRVTRWAVRARTDTLDGDQVKESSQDIQENESDQSDYAQKSGCVPDASISSQKRPLLLVSAEPKAAETSKKQKYAAERTQETVGFVLGLPAIVDNRSQKKSISSKNHGNLPST